jgi:hypothetical protein
MHFVSRRQAMKLASSFAAAFPLLNGSASRAQVKPGTEATVFEMADFVKGAPDAAFARALALGRTKIVELTKRKAPELKAKIAPIWKNKSPTTQPELIYDIELQEELPLKIADAVTSRCSFHACGHVVVKSPNSVARGRIAKTAVAVDPSCVSESIHPVNNSLT